MTETLLASNRETEHQKPGLFPTVSIDEVTPAAELILKQSIEDAGYADLESAGIDALSEFTYPNGDKAYFVTYTSKADEFMTEESTLLIDTTPDGDVSGVGDIRLFKEFKGMPGLVGRPFVGFTKTHEDFRRRGLAEKRLHAMNAIANGLYGEPLRSGTHQVQEVIPLWEKLVREGAAITLPDSGEFSYQFKYPDNNVAQASEGAPLLPAMDTTAATAASGMRKFFRRKR